MGGGPPLSQLTRRVASHEDTGKITQLVTFDGFLEPEPFHQERPKVRTLAAQPGEAKETEERHIRCSY